jgi:hypothetical protein
MIQVDASGERLRSTNSKLSYVLGLLDLLDLRPGQRVFEIGSGSGWLAAVMARLALRVALAELPFWDEIGRLPPRRVPLPLAMGPDGAAGSAVSAFRAFLGRTAAGFAIFGDGDPPEERPWLPAEPFGILDRAEHSVALWNRGELLAYGGASAMRVLAQAFANWTSYGLPGLADFAIQVVRIGRVWTEPRGGTALVWRLLPGAKDWKGAAARRTLTVAALARVWPSPSNPAVSLEDPDHAQSICRSYASRRRERRPAPPPDFRRS